MSSIAALAVNIQTSSQSIPSTLCWLLGISVLE
jgi:hypothetical protein